MVSGGSGGRNRRVCVITAFEKAREESEGEGSMLLCLFINLKNKSGSPIVFLLHIFFFRRVTSFIVLKIMSVLRAAQQNNLKQQQILQNKH